jgi:hypothetical protein
LAVDVVNAGQRRVAFLLAQQPREFVFENDVERQLAVIAGEMARDQYVVGIAGDFVQRAARCSAELTRTPMARPLAATLVFCSTPLRRL